jgi:hypothetical protein
MRHTILFLMAMSSIFFCLPHAKGCGGVCVVGGGSSYDFMGDPAVNIDMSSPDEFIRDNLGNHQTTLSVKSLSQEPLPNANSSLNQTNKGNVSQNSTAVLRVINSKGNMTTDNMTSDNKIIKLGASGMQDKRLSTLAFATFNNNMF